MNINIIKKLAYKIVLNDMMKENAPCLFKGEYDAKNGKADYMYGINTVIEFIAYNVSDTIGNKVSDKFVNNMIKSEHKAEMLTKKRDHAEYIISKND